MTVPNWAAQAVQVILLAILAFVGNEIWSDLKEARDDIADMKVQLASAAGKREHLEQTIRRLQQEMDVLESSLREHNAHHARPGGNP